MHWNRGWDKMDFVLPELFEEKMKTLLGEEWLTFWESYAGNRFQALRMNQLKLDVSPDKEKQVREKFCLEKQVPWAKNAYYYESDVRPGKHPYHEIGVYYIQEPSAMSAASVLDPKPGMRVLDLCAAPGGKSTQIASMLLGKGLLVSNEIHPARCKILSQNMERMGVTNAIVTNEDSENLANHFGCFYHAILVDAPCSGEGMFRKNQEAVEEWSEENVAVCAKRQQEILENASKMLLPGGKLVYSTCTFSPEENEQTIAVFLSEHEDFEVLEMAQNCFDDARPEWILQESDKHISEEVMASISKTKRLWPHKLQGEGHYVALLRKKGVLPEYHQMNDESQFISNKSAEKQKKSKVKNKKADKTKGSLVDYNLVDEFLTATFDEEMCTWIKDGRFELFGEQLYRLPKEEVSLKGLHVLRAGLHIGEFKKNRFEPSHALALAVSMKHVKNVIMIPEEDERTFAYFRGEAFEVSDEEIQIHDGSQKGWFLLCINGISAGWCKLAGGRLKNHYPKGLRKELREFA